MSAPSQPPVVWITGASSGIGEALARTYAQAPGGAELILSARSADKLEALRASLPEPDRVRVLPVDLNQPDSLPEVIEAALSWKNRIDVLVNNAGISQRSQILDTDMPTCRRVMEVNFFGAVALTVGVVPGMVERGHGRIVNISSVTGYVATPGRGAYAASKHAIRGWSDGLRCELTGTGVSVTIICPGYVQTAIARNALQGDGNALNADDPSVQGGITAEAMATRIHTAAQRGEREVYFGGKEILAIYIKRYAPGFGAWLLSKVYPPER